MAVRRNPTPVDQLGKAELGGAAPLVDVDAGVMVGQLLVLDVALLKVWLLQTVPSAVVHWASEKEGKELSEWVEVMKFKVELVPVVKAALQKPGLAELELVPYEKIIVCAE